MDEIDGRTQFLRIVKFIVFRCIIALVFIFIVVASNTYCAIGYIVPYNYTYNAEVYIIICNIELEMVIVEAPNP